MYYGRAAVGVSCIHVCMYVYMCATCVYMCVQCVHIYVCMCEVYVCILCVYVRMCVCCMWDLTTHEVPTGIL